MSLITLTQAERDKFAAWLEQEAISDDGMATQMETLPQGRYQLLVKNFRMKASAKMLVVKEIRSIEEMSIG